MNSYLRPYVFNSYFDTTLPDVIGKLDGVVSESASVAHKISLAQAPLLLPDLVNLLEEIIVKAEDRPNVRAYAGGLLTFVYNPLDFIGDEPPAGLVDDVIVCASGLMKLAEEGTVQLEPIAVGLVRSTVELTQYLEQNLLSAIDEFVEQLDVRIVPGLT